MILNLKGTHGTTKTRYNTICSERFDCKGKGRGGTGAYFWEDSPYSEDLAIAWYLSRMASGTYSRDADTTCTILTACLNLPEDEFLNLESVEIKRLLLEFIKDKDISDNRTNGARLHDLFIEMMEKVLGNPINVFRVNVYPPNKPRCYPGQLVGQPGCYVARTPKCITINKSEFYNNEDLDTWKTAKES